MLPSLEAVTEALARVVVVAQQNKLPDKLFVLMQMSKADNKRQLGPLRIVGPRGYAATSQVEQSEKLPGGVCRCAARHQADSARPDSRLGYDWATTGVVCPCCLLGARCSVLIVFISEHVHREKKPTGRQGRSHQCRHTGNGSTNLVENRNQRNGIGQCWPRRARWRASARGMDSRVLLIEVRDCETWEAVKVVRTESWRTRGN